MKDQVTSKLIQIIIKLVWRLFGYERDVTICTKYHLVIMHCTTCIILMCYEACDFVVHECGTERNPAFKSEVHLTVRCA